MSIYIGGLPDVAHVTGGAGDVVLVSGAPISTSAVLDTTIGAGLVDDADVVYAAVRLAPPQSLVVDLVADADAIYAATIARIAVVLPGLITDDDSFPTAAAIQFDALSPALYAVDDVVFSPTVVAGGITIAPVLVSAADTFPGPFITLVGLPGGPQQKLKPPPKHQDNDIIYAFTSSKMSGLVTDIDIIRAPIVTANAIVLPSLVTDADSIMAIADVANSNRQQPALVASDDAVYGALISMILQPELLDADDAIPAADVGWQVIAEFTDDADVVYAINVHAYNELLPEPWMDEEHVDTYPFFVQALEGGIPVPPREGVLKGSISKSPQLKGSITTRRAA